MTPEEFAAFSDYCRDGLSSKGATVLFHQDGTLFLIGEDDGADHLWSIDAAGVKTCIGKVTCRAVLGLGIGIIRCGAWHMGLEASA